MADDSEELLEVAARFRTQLEARARAGLLGVARQASPRRHKAASGGERAPAAGPGAASATGAASAGAGGLRAPTPQAQVDTGEAAEGPAPGLPGGATGLRVVRDDLGDCQRCKLAPLRTNLVYGVGNPEANLVFVGEAPGADEDAQGEPFVGKAGQLLTKMIEAMGFARADVYICNILKCRPPGNRNPEPDEVAACEPFLRKQLDAIRPRVIVALGKFAAQCLLRDDTPISRLRGTFRSYQGIKLMPTFHPAYLLRDPTKKKETWSDLRQVIAALKQMGIEPPRPPAANG